MQKYWFLCIAMLAAMFSEAQAQNTEAARLAKLEAIYGKHSREELLRLISADLRTKKQRAHERSALASVAEKPMDVPPPKAVQTANTTTVLLLRDVYSNVAFLSGEANASADGASFTYMSDNLAKSRTLAGQGALYLASFGDVNTNWPVDRVNETRMTGYSFVPGFEWDITSKDKSKSTGSYSGRIGAEFEFQGAPITTQYLRTSAIYTTDVKTSTAKIYGAEASWQPKYAPWNINTSRNIGGGTMFGFFPTLNLNYFHVGDAAQYDNLINGDSYFWVGPQITAKLYFRPGHALERFSFSGEYIYMPDLMNHKNALVRYAKATANFKLFEWTSEVDPTSLASLSFTGRYTKGKTPRTLEEVDELYTGISLILGQIPPPGQN